MIHDVSVRRAAPGQRAGGARMLRTMSVAAAVVASALARMSQPPIGVVGLFAAGVLLLAGGAALGMAAPSGADDGREARG